MTWQTCLLTLASKPARIDDHSLGGLGDAFFIGILRDHMIIASGDSVGEISSLYVTKSIARRKAQ